MVDFWQTLEGQTFRAQLKTLSHNIAELNEQSKETLEKQIYAQLVVQDFYQDAVGLSYKDLKRKAKEAAEAFFEN